MRKTEMAQTVLNDSLYVAFYQSKEKPACIYSYDLIFSHWKWKLSFSKICLNSAQKGSFFKKYVFLGFDIKIKG